MAFETIKSRIPIIRDMSPMTGTLALLGLGTVVGLGGYKFGQRRGWFGQIDIYGPGTAGLGGGRTAQQSRFSRAARKCKGRKRGAFQSCMSRELGGSGTSGLGAGPKRKRRKAKPKKRTKARRAKASPRRKTKGKARRRSSKRGTAKQMAQRNRMKRAAKTCRGKKGTARKTCMRRALKK